MSVKFVFEDGENTPSSILLKNTYNKYKDEDLEGKINLLLNVV